MNPLKLTVARALAATRISPWLVAAQTRVLKRHIRAVNYHDVPARLAADFERQLRFYKRHYVSAGLDELRTLEAGRWQHARPGLMLTFDDGYRSHAEVVAPLLERHGFVGWFMIPTGFVDAPLDEQAAFAAEHHLHAEAAPGERLAMSWDDVRGLVRRGHIIGCHTSHHERLRHDLTQAELEQEIPVAKARLEEQLDCAVDVFAWVGGEEWAYGAGAARAIEAAGFRYGLMTNTAIFRPGDSLLHVERSNIEAHFPDALVYFHLSGLMDLLYAPKRRRVRRATAHPHGSNGGPRPSSTLRERP